MFGPIGLFLCSLSLCRSGLLWDCSLRYHQYSWGRKFQLVTLRILVWSSQHWKSFSIAENFTSDKKLFLLFFPLSSSPLFVLKTHFLRWQIFRSAVFPLAHFSRPKYEMERVHNFGFRSQLGRVSPNDPNLEAAKANTERERETRKISWNSRKSRDERRCERGRKLRNELHAQSGKLSHLLFPPPIQREFDRESMTRLLKSHNDNFAE